VLGEKTKTNVKMDFGSAVGKRLETDPDYMKNVPRQERMEHGVKVKMGNIELYGVLDSYSPITNAIEEYKTSGEKGWDQKKVDSHDQITFYALLLYLEKGIKPETLSIRLHHLVTEEQGDFSIAFKKPFTHKVYKTKRTTKQVLQFGAEIIKVRKEMELYITKALSNI
jgi:hypothetical protein